MLLFAAVRSFLCTEELRTVIRHGVHSDRTDPVYNSTENEFREPFEKAAGKFQLRKVQFKTGKSSRKTEAFRLLFSFDIFEFFDIHKAEQGVLSDGHGAVYTPLSP
jgi:hypothetical protein